MSFYETMHGRSLHIHARVCAITRRCVTIASTVYAIPTLHRTKSLISVCLITHTKPYIALSTLFIYSSLLPHSYKPSVKSTKYLSQYGSNYFASPKAFCVSEVVTYASKRCEYKQTCLCEIRVFAYRWGSHICIRKFGFDISTESSNL